MAETEFKYDVFISYTSANKDWVRKIFVPTLEKAGLRCCDYYRDFDAGAPIVKEMENAVLNSRKTILVLSPAYLERAWTEFENLMLQTLDPANQERRLLPVIIEKCELPLRIKYMNCINFANPDDVEIEWQRLSRALGVTLSPSTLDTKTPDTGSRDTWHLAHPYPMPPNFTGRVAEQTLLDDWLADNTNRLFILRALGGFGKSALTWQWINTHVNPAEWTKLVWWSFYEGDASFEHFTEETLKYLKLEAPQGQRPQVDELLKAMQSQKILLIMDGFERALRAYSSMNAAYQGDEPKIEDNQLDCVNINAEIFLKSVCSLPNIKSKVLMTTRLTPRTVKPRGEFMLGCREEELTAMQPVDAVEFFRKQGIKGTHTEIEAACAPYGYHPLSLRLLAGRILKDFDNPADIVVTQKLKIDGDIIQQKHHVLEVSYDSLPKHEQKLLSTITCFRSPVELETLQSIIENKDTLDNDLHGLVERGLLHFDDRNKKFDLHPIVRQYTYDRLTTTDRTAVHKRLVNYFDAIPKLEKVEKLEDLVPVIELYYHMVRAGELNKAFELFRDRLHDMLYYQLGKYQLVIELMLALFFDGIDKLPHLKDKGDQAWALIALALAYGTSGQLHHTIPLIEHQIAIREKQGAKKNIAIGIANLAIAQFFVGKLKESVSNNRRSIELLYETESDRSEASTHRELGRVLAYLGLWDEAKQELEISLKLAKDEQDNQMQGMGWLYLSIYALLRIRDSAHLSTRLQRKVEARKSANEYAQHALKLAKEYSQLYNPNEREFIRAHWLLGASYHSIGVLTNSSISLAEAESHLSESLTRCRVINLVESEANILLDLARLRYDQAKYEETKSLADEALLITERCGYVLQGADVNLFLAQYALEQEKDEAKAKEYAEEALKLATCDGPPYYYKVAYEEAERFLEQLAG